MENNDSNRKVLILSIIGVLVLISLVVGATYAYFTFSSDNQFGTQTIEATTEAIGSGVTLTKTGEPLKLDVSAIDMLEDKVGSSYYASGSETPATIGTIKATGEGTFNCTYTMTISATSTSEDKNLYTKFQNMSNKTEGQIYLDVNEQRYDFNTANLFPITYSGTVNGITSSQDSYITANLTIANTNIDQTELNDADISLTFEVTQFDCDYISEDTKPVINSVTKTSNETDSITIEVDATSTNGISKYYYSIDNNEYVESDSNTYTYEELSDNTSYSISVYVTDIYNLKSDVYTITFSTNEIPLASEEIFSMQTTGLNTTMEAGLYRYQGTTADNYICFGTSDKDTCTGNTDAYMYRIIGINESEQLKLIKKEALNEAMGWDSWYTSTIAWPNSTIYSNINGSSFLTNTTYVPSGWSDKIATTSWKYGDNTVYNATAANLYSKENAWTDTVGAKIGLWYMHDYYYAYQSGGDNCYNSNTTCKTSWIYLWQEGNDTAAPNTDREWTMSRYGADSSGNYTAFLVGSNGRVGHTYLNTSSSVRPVFFLESSVEFVDGTGTSSDPFIIK